MQMTGYVVINGDKVRVLVRSSKNGRSLKVRRSGQYGAHFEDETLFLTGRRVLAAALLSGRVVKL